MIGKLSGRVDSVSGHQIIVDVQGVGYVVSASARTLRRVGGSGDVVSLLIETQVREDAISLFGFIDALERDWFRLLTTVQGVGARVALSILSSLSPESLADAILAQDKAAVSQADGVGPKLALRLVTELKDKVIQQFTPSSSSGVVSASAPSVENGAAAQALSALVNLGYKRVEAFSAVTSAIQKLGANAPLDQVIRTSLADVGRKDRVS